MRLVPGAVIVASYAVAILTAGVWGLLAVGLHVLALLFFMRRK